MKWRCLAALGLLLAAALWARQEEQGGVTMILDGEKHCPDQVIMHHCFHPYAKGGPDCRGKITVIYHFGCERLDLSQ